MTSDMQPLVNEPTQSRNRWLKFSLWNLLVVVTLVACLLNWLTKKATAPLQVRIANVRSMVGVGHELPPDQLHVIVTNVSNGPVQIWDQWNSWGYHNLSLSLESEDGSMKELRRFGGKDWSQNAADAIELKPNEHYVFAVWLKPSENRIFNNSWGPVDVGSGDYPSVKIKAHYEVPSDADANRNGVWSGRISSPAITIQLN